MKLTDESMRKLGAGNIVENRVLQDEESGEPLHILQRRNNVRRIYYAAIVFFMLVVPTIVFGCEFHIFHMSSKERIVGLVSNSIVMGIFFIQAKRLHRQNKREWHQLLYCTFWMIVLGEIMFLMSRSQYVCVQMGLFFFGTMVLGGVPYLTKKERVLFWSVMALFGGVACYHERSGYTELPCMVSWWGMSLWLSTVRYSRYMGECRQKRELRHAVLEAETDPLTKLLNRRGMDRSLYSIIPYCVRNKLSVAVVMIDIDYFKHYNDAFGHDMGDQCIQQVALKIKEATRRKTDIAARSGGEEFLVFLSGLDEEQALKWVSRLQESIENLNLRHADSARSEIVTVSAGVHCSSIHSREEFQELFELADEELYCAKKNGRACVSIKGSCYRSERMQRILSSASALRRRQA